MQFEKYCVKSVQIRSFSGPYIRGFGLITDRYFYRYSDLFVFRPNAEDMDQEKLRIQKHFSQWRFRRDMIVR